MSIHGAVLALCGSLWFSTASAQIPSNITFDKDRYDIDPGEVFRASVLIDPIPTAELYSYRVEAIFDGSHLAVSGTADHALDFNGILRAGALKSVQSPSTNLIVVMVTDNGSPPLSLTSSILLWSRIHASR